MKIDSDKIRVRTDAIKLDGSPTEPEEIPTERILTTRLPITQGGTMAGEVIYSVPAGQLAQGLRYQCQFCRHFKPEAWQRLRGEWERGTLAQRDLLNGVRASLSMTQNAEVADRHAGQDGDFDIEHALSHLGICPKLTEMYNEPVIVYPMSGCPAETVSADKPIGFFEAKDRESSTAGSQVFDAIMQAAAKGV